MHICFIIDNSLNLEQQCHNSCSILDYIKMSIEQMVKDLLRNGFSQNNNQILHLYVTSDPDNPLSSYEHKQLHFNYQLKNIKTSTLTFPGWTLKSALKSIGKYRILTETETPFGYRQPTVYEPALILFFSAKLSQRKMIQIKEMLDLYTMRSEYKFYHFQICIPTKLQRVAHSIQTLKDQIQKSLEHKKIEEIAYSLNQGQVKNIYNPTGKQSLQQQLANAMNSYRPSLCVNFHSKSLEGDDNFKKQSTLSLIMNELFRSSQISNYTNDTWNDKYTKTELQMREKQNRRNKIPFPQEIKFNKGSIDIQISQFEIPNFYIDFKARLNNSFAPYSDTNPQNFTAQAQQIFLSIPFEYYTVSINQELQTPFQNNLSRIQRILIKSKNAKIYFPVYIKSKSFPGNQSNNRKQQYVLIGLLHVIPSASLYQLIISFPNFPLLNNLIKAIQSRRSYSDQKQVQGLLWEYLMSVPNIYMTVLQQFFKINFKIDIPNDKSWYSEQLKLQDKIRSVRINKDRLEQRQRQNLIKHQQNIAPCCPIYDNLENYQMWSQVSSKIKNISSTTSALVFQNILLKIDEFHKKLQINNYFSLRNMDKCIPVTRQMNRHREGIEEFNADIVANFGKNRRKRRSQQPQFRQQQNFNLDESGSESDLSEDTPFHQVSPPQPQNPVMNILNLQKAQIQINKSIQAGNSSNLFNQNSKAYEYTTRTQDNQQMQPEIRSSNSIKSNLSNQADAHKLDILEFVNSIVDLKYFKTMNINTKNVRNQKYMQNQQKLNELKRNK